MSTELKEPILDDDYPVYFGYLYVADGKVISSDIEGTIRHLKANQEGLTLLSFNVADEKVTLRIAGPLHLLWKFKRWAATSFNPLSMTRMGNEHTIVFPVIFKPVTLSSFVSQLARRLGVKFDRVHCSQLKSQYKIKLINVTSPPAIMDPFLEALGELGSGSIHFENHDSVDLYISFPKD